MYIHKELPISYNANPVCLQNKIQQDVDCTERQLCKKRFLPKYKPPNYSNVISIERCFYERSKLKNESNNQESKKLPNAFRHRHQRERGTH